MIVKDSALHTLQMPDVRKSFLYENKYGALRGTRFCSNSSGKTINIIDIHVFEFCFTCPGLDVIKLFSSSAQLSMKFQLLINVEKV